MPEKIAQNWKKKKWNKKIGKEHALWTIVKLVNFNLTTDIFNIDSNTILIIKSKYLFVLLNVDWIHDCSRGQWFDHAMGI